MEKKLQDVYISEEGMNDLWNVWYSELHNGNSGLTLKIERVLESLVSPFQRIEVLQNNDFGKMLVLYGSLMVADNDKNAYNEMLAHVPLFSHPSPKEVLIIGGGDCGCLTEVLAHPEVERCTMCEIDEMVVEVSRKHFPKLTRGLDDKRANLKFQDGKKFIEESVEKFDIVLLDLSDPIGPAADLFQKTFHQTVFNRLNDDGIMVAQTESPFFNQKTIKLMYKNLKDIFPIVKMYTCFMPIYPSTLWSFAFCSKKYDPIDDFDKNRLIESSHKTQYYNHDIHLGSFLLPQFAKKLAE
ncbi:MAG: polyamine aminopropyltransferase [candidate division Zixibacteria bacterium]|nr:polyamine aminopropyltransferase [candidate division Zixibacteria bacterium]